MKLLPSFWQGQPVILADGVYMPSPGVFFKNHFARGQDDVRSYSDLRTTIGSTWAARRAGR
jgi:hypothetical protein